MLACVCVCACLCRVARHVPAVCSHVDIWLKAIESVRVCACVLAMYLPYVLLLRHKLALWLKGKSKKKPNTI